MEFLLPLLGIGAIFSIASAKRRYDTKKFEQLQIESRAISKRLEQEEDERMREEARKLRAERKIEAERIAYLKLRREREALERKLDA